MSQSPRRPNRQQLRDRLLAALPEIVEADNLTYATASRLASMPDDVCLTVTGWIKRTRNTAINPSLIDWLKRAAETNGNFRQMTEAHLHNMAPKEGWSPDWERWACDLSQRLDKILALMGEGQSD